MKQLPALLVFTLFFNPCNCQSVDLEKKKTELETEGKKLYRSEMASWYGTNIFMKELKRFRYPQKGYFSYEDSIGVTCVFFSNELNARVIASITFDPTFNVRTARRDTTLRAFTPKEQVLYEIRQKAQDIVNTDSLFEKFDQTSFNLIPIVEGNIRKVYILTAPGKEDIVLFGNDYLLTYDENNNITGKQKLHTNLIAVTFNTKPDPQNPEIGSIHNHLPGNSEFITATDICTLMLYERFTHWKLHYVISKNYASIWNSETNQLVLMTYSAWDKMNKKVK
jgi:hypothetical protein